MKKALFLMAVMAIFFVNIAHGQLKSIYLVKAESLVESAVITHMDSTVSKTDTIYTRVETSPDSLFTFPFYTPWVQRIGSGEYTDILDSSLIQAGNMYYVRVVGSKDTTKITIKSNTRVVKPKYPPVAPTITLINKNPTTNGVTQKVGFTVGYCDSALISRIISLDSTYKNPSRKDTVVYADGTMSDNIPGGLLSDRYFYVKWTNTNCVGSKTLEYSFKTLGVNKKIFLKKTMDSILVTTTSINLYGTVESYGLPGIIFAKCNGIISDTVLITGNNKESYRIPIDGLAQNTSYSITIYGENALGKDSVVVGIITTKSAPAPFSITTNSASSGPSTINVNGTLSMTSGYSADVTCGLFEDNDPNGTVAIQSQTNVYKSSGSLYAKFDNVATGWYWVGFWGTCSNGEYDLNPNLFHIQVTTMVGEDEVESEIPISVHPNPTSDFIYYKAHSDRENNRYEIFNSVGQAVKNGILASGKNEISVIDLTPGIYFLVTENGRAMFVKK